MPDNSLLNRQVDNLLSANSPATLMGARGVLRFNHVPTWLVYVAILGIILSWVPLAWAVREKFTKSPLTRIHIFQDMDNQAKFKAQSRNLMFENQMSMRPPIPGTVARGELDADDHLFRGYDAAQVGEDGAPSFFEGLPEQIEVTPELMVRGKELYARYCYLCHGYDGYGNGPIHARASSNTGKNPKWVQPSNLNDEVRRGRADGHIYNTINVGIRNMAGYGQQIPDPADRWAIVAYVRALQMSQNAPADMVPEADRASAEVRPAMLNNKPLSAAPADAGGDGSGDPAETGDAATQPADNASPGE